MAGEKEGLGPEEVCTTPARTGALNADSLPVDVIREMVADVLEGEAGARLVKPPRRSAQLRVTIRTLGDTPPLGMRDGKGGQENRSESRRLGGPLDVPSTER